MWILPFVINKYVRDRLKINSRSGELSAGAIGKKSDQDLALNGRNSGQALLIILLVLSVALTVTLSAVSRSITDITITTYEEDSSRAYSAAEAGIEQALLTYSPIGETNLEGGGSYSVDLPDATLHGSKETSEPLSAGQSAVFWLVENNDLGILNCDNNNCVGHVSHSKFSQICWGIKDTYGTWDSTNPPPAVEVSVYYDWDDDDASDDGHDIGIGEGVDNGNFEFIKIARKAYDPIQHRRDNLNNFDPDTTSGSCTIDDIDFTYHKSGSSNDLDFDSDGFGLPDACWQNPKCLILAKVRVLYNSEIDSDEEKVGIVVQGSALPAQGIILDSSGKSGDTSRRVRIEQGYPEPPSIFDSALFSGSSISK